MDDHAAKTYESLITISLEGYRTLILLNGGAVVALLALLGQDRWAAYAPALLWGPCVYFVVGTLLGTFAFLFSYLTQFGLFNEAMKRGALLGVPHMAFFYVALAVVLGSIAAFAVGTFGAVCILSGPAPA